MDILANLKQRWEGLDYPFLIHSTGELRFNEISEQKAVDLSGVKSGDVVAVIGDFDPQSILYYLSNQFYFHSTKFYILGQNVLFLYYFNLFFIFY